MFKIPTRFKVNPVIKAARSAGGTTAAKSLGFGEFLGRFAGSAPEIRLQMYTAPSARYFGEILPRKDSALAKNFEGSASAQGLETNYHRVRDTMLGSTSENMKDLYVKYRQRMVKQPVPQQGMAQMKTRIGYVFEDISAKITRKDKPYITYKEFREEAAKARRRMSVGAMEPHPIPEVNKAARFYADAIFEPMVPRLIASGLIKENIAKNVNYVSSYLSQIWNIPAIQNNPQKILSLLTEYYTRTQKSGISTLETKISNWETKIGELEKQGRKTARYKKAAESARARLEARKRMRPDMMARDFINDITSSPYGMLLPDLPDAKKAKYQKSRAINIPKDMLDGFEEFLENDIEKIAFSYTRMMLPRLLLKEAFPGDDLALTGLTRQIAKEYDDLIYSPALSLKDKQSLMVEKNKALIDVKAIRDRFLGIYKLPEDPYSLTQSVSRSLLRLNNLRHLGFVTISSIPDMANHIRRNGMKRTAKTLGAVLSDPKFAGLAMDDLKRSVGIYEMLLHHRFFEQAEIIRGFQPVNFIEQGLERASDAFGILTLMSPWNQSMKQFASLNTASMILETASKVAKGGKLTKNELAKMLENGLTETHMKGIWDQFTRFGQQHNGILMPQTRGWENQALADIFNNAVRREVEISIITPGLASRPLWTSTTLGRHLGQFKSFSMTATQAITLNGLQYRDAAALNGFMLSIFLGGSVYVLREKMKGNDVKADPGKILAEGIDRSGVLGWLMDANNVIERASRGALGVHPWLDGSQSTRYEARDIYNLLGGPTIGTLADLVRTAGGQATLQPTMGDIRAARRLVPYQNLFYMRWLFDNMERGYANLWGVEE